MAETTDLQRLVVSMEANFKKWERALAKANGDADKSARRIESRFKKMNAGLAGQFTALGRNLGLAIGGAAFLRAAQTAVDASTRIENALRIAGLEGQELTAVYDQLFDAAQRNAAPVESLVELYGRAALVQKELGASSRELIAFSNNVALALRVSGKSAAESSGALLQLSQALGSGVVRAEEFNSILEGAPAIAQAAAAGLEEAGGSVARLRKLVIDGKVSSEAFFRAFEAGAVILEEKVAGAQFTAAQGFTRVQNAIIDAAGKFNEATGASDALGRSLNDLAEWIEAVGDYFATNTKPIRDWIGVLSDAWAQIEAVKNSIREGLGLDKLDRFLDGTSLLAGTVGLAPASGASGGPAFESSGRGSMPAVDGSKRSLEEFEAPAKTGGGKGRKQDQFANEIRQIQEATRALELELSLIGQTEQARDRARAVLELENAARRQGIKDIEAQRERIHELADAYAEAADRVRAAEDQMEAMNQLAQEFGSLAQDGIRGLIDGSRSLNDVLADMASRFADLALQATLLGQGPLAGLFGTKAAGGGVGGLIGALFGGFRAAGGPVSPGKAFVVGERGPELLVPKMSGTVIPNAKIGGGGSTSLTVNINLKGAAGNQEVARISTAAVEAALARFAPRVPDIAFGALGSRPGLRNAG